MVSRAERDGSGHAGGVVGVGEGAEIGKEI